ncbi:MAG: hypothetical protein HKN11_06105 [Rhizobiales bacterium]|nr:hypothetical protein [Hyphomicrobiales bacterium]
MERLIDNALIYGGLFRVDQPHLIQRYNQALQAFGLRKTKCKDFVIDATGFSPEVAKDLGDEHYLDPHGVNRRFIILSPSQGHLPVIYINFSSTPDLMRAFFKANAEAIKILTLKDVVYGEIENSTYKVDDIDDVLSIKRVRFALRTHNELLEKSHRLEKLVVKFKSNEDTWRDNKLLQDILGLAKDCGDIRHNSVVPNQTEFEVASFWTRHFGGIYVFHDDDDKAVVIGDMTTPMPLEGERARHRFIHLSDHDAIYTYLTETGRLEPLNPEWLETSGILDHRLEVCTRMALSNKRPSADLVWIGDVATNNWVHKNLDLLKRNKAFDFLTRLRKAIRNGLIINPDKHSATEKLMVVRATADHPDNLLVNRFLSEFVPFDFLTRYLVNKLAFYRDYETYNNAQRDYAVHVIKHRYFADKQALWNQYFG